MEAYRKRIQEAMEELRALSDGSREGRAPVELDQQSVGRLSRMDAMQQQSMDLAREGTPPSAPCHIGSRAQADGRG